MGKGSENKEDKTVEEKYLIATSEQPIAAYHRYSELLLAISILLSLCIYLYSSRHQKLPSQIFLFFFTGLNFSHPFSLIFLFTPLIVLVYPVRRLCFCLYLVLFLILWFWTRLFAIIQITEQLSCNTLKTGVLSINYNVNWEILNI